MNAMFANSQPPDHQSDAHSTEPPKVGLHIGKVLCNRHVLGIFYTCLSKHVLLDVLSSNT